MLLAWRLLRKAHPLVGWWWTLTAKSDARICRRAMVQHIIAAILLGISTMILVNSARVEIVQEAYLEGMTSSAGPVRVHYETVRRVFTATKAVSTEITHPKVSGPGLGPPISRTTATVRKLLWRFDKYSMQGAAMWVAYILSLWLIGVTLIRLCSLRARLDSAQKATVRNGLYITAGLAPIFGAASLLSGAGEIWFRYVNVSLNAIDANRAYMILGAVPGVVAIWAWTRIIRWDRSGRLLGRKTWNG